MDDVTEKIKNYCSKEFSVKKITVECSGYQNSLEYRIIISLRKVWECRSYDVHTITGRKI